MNIVTSVSLAIDAGKDDSWSMTYCQLNPGSGFSVDALCARMPERMDRYMMEDCIITGAKAALQKRGFLENE